MIFNMIFKQKNIKDKFPFSVSNVKPKLTF